MVVNSVPVPYKDASGNPIDPKDVIYQEYYHHNANEKAIEEFNNWVDSQHIEILRNEKLKTILNA